MIVEVVVEWVGNETGSTRGRDPGAREQGARVLP